MVEAPAIILVSPQMGENIGAAARVMLNFDLTDLRLVAPRDGWPNPQAETMSAGALPDRVTVSVFDSVDDAVADCVFVLATTARPRGMVKPVHDLSGGLKRLGEMGDKGGVLFGAERSGLPNDMVAKADAILTYPVNTAFSSLNLAQAVAVFAHGWGAHVGEVPEAFDTDIAPAQCRDVDGLIGHIVSELDRSGFFHPPEKRDVMVQNITAALVRTGWTEQEVRTFRGIIKSLSRSSDR